MSKYTYKDTGFKFKQSQNQQNQKQQTNQNYKQNKSTANNYNESKKQKNKQKQIQIFKTLTQQPKYKVPFYPYYPLSFKYEIPSNNQNDYTQLFIFSVQYPNNIPCLSYTMVQYIKKYFKNSENFNQTQNNYGKNNKKQTVKNCSFRIDLAGINDTSSILTLQIIDFKWKENQYNVIAVQGKIMIGYKSGHLIILKFKEKKIQILHKLNKSSKKQNIMSKTMSFFNQQQCYKIFFQGPIKEAFYCTSRKFGISYLVGNYLVFLKYSYLENIDSIQQAIQKMYKSEIQLNTNKVKDIKLLNNNVGILIKFSEDVEIGSYKYTQKQQIIISFNMESMIKFYSAKNLQLLLTIQLKMPIRRFNYNSFNLGNYMSNNKLNKSIQYLTILPYQDYIILIELDSKKYIKLTGHRCFIANSILYENQDYDNKLIILTAGMDHRVCFDKVQNIKNWNYLTEQKTQNNKNLQKNKQNQNIWQVDQEISGIQFSNKYSTGQYSNARTNNHDYGFSDLLGSGSVLVVPTYDSKVKYFSLHYK